MKNLLNAILRDEEGQGMVEYGLIIAGVVVAVVIAVAALGDKIKVFFDGIDLQAPGSGT